MCRALFNERVSILQQSVVDRRKVWMENSIIISRCPSSLSRPPLCPPLSLVGQTMVRWQWSPEPPPPRPLITGHCPKPWLSTGGGGGSAFMTRLRKLQRSASGLNCSWHIEAGALVRAHQSPAPDPGPQRAHCQHLPRHCWPSTALCRRLIPRFLSVALGSLLIPFPGL